MRCRHKLDRRFVGGFLVLTAFVELSANSRVQGQGWMPANATMFDKEGAVAGVLPNTIQMVTQRKAKWLIQVVPGLSQVRVRGAATPAFLHAGLLVRFSGEIDDAGVLKHEIKELEVFTPVGRYITGAFINGADENAKPIGKIIAGAYDFRGKVISYQTGGLQIVAGKKISGKVAGDAKIALNLQDISLAQADDALKVKGYYFKGGEPSPSKNRPGQALGRMIEITLAKPLTMAAQNRPIKPTRPVPNPKLPLEPKVPLDKPPVVASDPSAPAVDPDPFGFNKDVGKK